MDYELLPALAVSASWAGVKSLLPTLKSPGEWIIKCIELPSNWFTFVLSLLVDGTRLSQCNRKDVDRGVEQRNKKLHEKAIPRSFIGENLNYYLWVRKELVPEKGLEPHCALTIIINCCQHSIRTRARRRSYAGSDTKTPEKKELISMNFSFSTVIVLSIVFLLMNSEPDDVTEKKLLLILDWLYTST